jgi:hypothetical protein
MLERAILAGCSDDKDLRGIFQSPEKVTQLYDEKLLEVLEKIKGFPQDTAAAIISKRGLFVKIYDRELSVGQFPGISQNFLEAIRPAGASEASFGLSEKVCETLKTEQDQIICDLVKSRVPHSIHVDERDSHGDPIELKSKSSIIGAIKEKIRLKAYIHPSLYKKMEEKTLSKAIEGLVASW